MSYCRWSSMDFGCDIYAFEHVGGWWQIYVAGNRVVGDIPKTPAVPPPGATEAEKLAWATAYVETSRMQSQFLKTAEREDITLPHAGEAFQCPTIEDFRAKMLELRELGYVFPDAVFDEIDEELAASPTLKQLAGE